MSWEHTNVEAIREYNQRIIVQTENESLKAVVRKLLEEREILLKWIDGMLVSQAGFDFALTALKSLKSDEGLNIWQAWKGAKGKTAADSESSDS